MEYENYEKAERIWKESLKLKSTVTAHRCLAVAFERKGELEAACREMEEVRRTLVPPQNIDYRLLY